VALQLLLPPIGLQPCACAGRLWDAPFVSAPRALQERLRVEAAYTELQSVTAARQQLSTELATANESVDALAAELEERLELQQQLQDQVR
jgi:hypothetical protein